MATSFSKRKGLLSHMLATKKNQVLGRVAKPPAAGLHGEDRHAHHPGIDRALLYHECGEERYKLF